jgi:hypothetical protein
VRTSYRALALVALLHLASGGVVAAQTLVVRNAMPGSTIELVVNGSPAGSVQADAIGDATLPIPLLQPAQREALVRLFVDRCGERTQVVVVGADEPVPPAGVGCTRRVIEGLYVLRSITGVAVDLSPTQPTVRIRQGRVPDEWFRPAADIVQRRREPPAGSLVLSATGTMTALPRARDIECGIFRPCQSETTQPGYAGGAAYWFTRRIGAGIQYMRPGTMTVSGGPLDQSYSFNTRWRTEDVASVAGMVGLPLGPVRLYGLGGLNRHRATVWMTQTVSDFTVEIDDDEVTFPGGTQTVVRRTAGIGWLAGGGAEFWTARRLALFAEGGVHSLRGSAVDDAEYHSDGRMPFLHAGIRFRLW